MKTAEAEGGINILRTVILSQQAISKHFKDMVMIHKRIETKKC